MKCAINGCGELTKRGQTRCKWHENYKFTADPPTKDELEALSAEQAAMAMEEKAAPVLKKRAILKVESEG